MQFVILYRRADHADSTSLVIDATDIDHAAARAIAHCIDDEFVAGVWQLDTPPELVASHAATQHEHYIDHETPAEELGRLRRELTEHPASDRDTPEHAATLDRIAVLTREAAEARGYKGYAASSAFLSFGPATNDGAALGRG